MTANDDHRSKAWSPSVGGGTVAWYIGLGQGDQVTVISTPNISFYIHAQVNPHFLRP